MPAKSKELRALKNSIKAWRKIVVGMESYANQMTSNAALAREELDALIAVLLKGTGKSTKTRAPKKRRAHK
jgi:hypothetical protein